MGQWSCEWHYSVQNIVQQESLLGLPFLHKFLRLADMKRLMELSWKFVQRVNISFCVKLGWTQSHTVLIIQELYGADALCRTSIRKWFNAFKSGRTQLVDLQRTPCQHSGQSQGNIDTIKALVQGDRRLTVESLSAQTGVPHSRVHTILRKDLKLRKKCACFIPKQLTPRHIWLRFDISSMMLRIVRERPGTLKKIITMDESWIYTYDPLSRAQSSEWLAPGEPRPQILCRTLAVSKVLLVSFFDWRGMVYYKMLRNCEYSTVNTQHFLAILGRLQAALDVRRPHRRHQIHMDNATPHNAPDTKMQMLLTGVRRVPHPPCSPDLAPNDYWFYPRLKRNLKGKTFANLDQLEAAVHQEIGLIPAEEYQKCMLETWPMHWAQCVFCDGGYFEGLN